jgi:hypothetical protein
VAVRWLTAFLDFPAAVFGPGCVFWQAVTASTLSPAGGAAGQLATLLPGRGDAFLRVRRTSGGRPGCRLDVHCDDVQAMVRRAVELGAGVVDDGQRGRVVMSSPASLVFRVVRYGGEAQRPAPTVWPGGYRSLVDQVSRSISCPAISPPRAPSGRP